MFRIGHNTIKLYFLIPLILYISGTSFIIAKENNSDIILSVLFFFALIENKYTLFRFSKSLINFFYYTFLLAILWSFAFNFNFSHFLNYFRFIALISTAYLFAKNFNAREISKVFINVLLFLTLYSILLQIIFRLSPQTLNIFGSFTSEGGTQYINAIFACLLKHAPERNIGIFWEPGINASFLTLALIVNSCVHYSRLSSFSNLVFIIGLLLTNSTASYLLVALALLIIQNHNKKSNHYLNFFLFILLVITILNLDQLINYLISINPDLFSKLKNNSISLSTRLLSPMVDLEIFTSKPISGVGIINYFSLYEIKTFYTEFLEAQTSTITYYLAAFGILSSSFLISIIIGVINICKNNKIMNILIILCILFVLSKEPHQNNLLTWVVLMFIFKGR